MSKLNQVEVDKIAALEQAVINDTPDKVSKLYKELGEVILTAHILGLACRMRGLEMVKVLVENGASFRYDADTIRYALLGEIYLGEISKSSLPDLFTSFLFPDINKITEYSLREYLMALTDRDGNALKPICEEALIQVAAYLCDNAEKVCFHPGALLYFSILMDEQNMTAALKGRGVTISDEKKKMLTEGGGDNAWRNYCYFVQCLKGDDFMRIMSTLLSEVGRDKKLYFAESFYDACCCYGKFFIPENFQFIMEHFNHTKMKKTKFLKEIIRDENVSCLEIAANEGWLKIPRMRDEMIQYAMDNNKTECTAFLLEFKNRTADLAAEQEKAEKKLMRELNMSPDSMAALKKIWSWRKREDGTLIITNYKG
ncbi:MAG: hypothetical protein K2M91_06990, partial [Lachnospiraceae bacterium]|nr:hypothetical protein [Lachnospiraceae bacterium]